MSQTKSILLSRDNGSFVTEVANGTSTVNTTSSGVPALITTQAYQMTQMQRSIENGQNEDKYEVWLKADQ